MEDRLKDWIQSSSALLDVYYQLSLPYLENQQFQYPLLVLFVLLSWWISYKLGGKKESHGMLNDDVKRQLEEFEQDATILAISVEKACQRVSDMKYFRLLAAGISISLLAYQSLIHGIKSSATMIAAVGAATVIISAELYRIYLIRYISKMNFKIKQEQNQQQYLIQQILNEMNDQMKNALRNHEIIKQQLREYSAEYHGIISYFESSIFIYFFKYTIAGGLVLGNAVRAIETERESFRNQCEVNLAFSKSSNEQEMQALKREYDAKVAGILSMSKSQSKSNTTLTKQLLEKQLQQLQQQQQVHCVNTLCKKKKKLLKEKIKRNDWFIRNLSEFAWCSICAAHLNNPITAKENQLPSSQNATPNHSRQGSQNVSFQADPSMLSLDDSLMNSSSTNTLSTLPDEKTQNTIPNPFQHLQDQAQQIINTQESQQEEECVSGCLTKYFFLCRKVGEKYNEWTDLISTFESKYKHEKEKIKRLSQSQQQVSAQQGSKPSASPSLS